FQAEDGIRDRNVTGVQTCALPISAEDRTSLLSGLAHDPVLRDVFLPLTSGAALHIPPASAIRDPRALIRWINDSAISIAHTTPRSEERRVGKECRSRGARADLKKT